MTPQNEVDGSNVRDEREDDLFTAIGKRVQDLEIDDTTRLNRLDEDNEEGDERAEARVVDKIESLCMNCQDNVSVPFAGPDAFLHELTTSCRAKLDFS